MRKVKTTAEIALLLGGAVALELSVRFVANNHPLVEIMQVAPTAFVLSALFFFFALLNARGPNNALSPWFVAICIGAAVLYVPSLALFDSWLGSLALPALWLILILAIRSLAGLYHWKKLRTNG